MGTAVARHRGRRSSRRPSHVRVRREADRAAGALESAHRELEALLEVALEAGRQVDPQRLAEFTVARARASLTVDTASLMWWDDDAGVLRRMARNKVTGAPGPEVVRPGEAVSGVAFARRAPVIVDDVLSWPDRPAAGSGHRSAMAVPMTIGQRIVGVLFVGSLAPRRFTHPEARLLSLLAAEVAPAIETSHLLAAAQRAAQVDALTGLPNRSALTAGIGLEIEEALRRGSSLALMYVDVDDFRSVNDAFGYAAGNEVLREIAARIAGIGPLARAAARFGADEFVVCLPLGSGAADARRAAELVIRAIAEPFVSGGQTVHLAASVGFVVSDGRGETAEQILQKAERAMRAAKESRSGYVEYGPELDPHSQQKLSLLSELRAAIATGQLFLRYQPQIDTETGALVGAEALVRWRHPEMGIVLPAAFVPAAEESGLIVELTEWVIDRALAELDLWHDSVSPARVSVNVGARNLRDPSFADAVAASLRAHGVAPERLILEITEGAAMLDADRSVDALRRIRRLGVGVSIDDFGTGYSSLAQLGQLPADEIKVDRSFVSGSAAGDRAIARAVIELGRAFGLRVVAEGVEEPEALAWLRGLGCPVVQGFLLGRPVSAEDLARLLTRSG